MKKRIVSVFLLMVFALLVAVPAFSVDPKVGSTYYISYRIIWNDTREEIDSGSITYNCTRGYNYSVENWASKQLGFGGAYTKNVNGRKQRLILSVSM